MGSSNYDVVIVGAGCAGLTAAIGLARAGFRVAAVEAAAYPGAENWSGCVYFCEQLAEPDILGPEGVEALAWERRLVERGFFATDGHSLLGMTYRDPQAFRHCYTVLRPIFDHHMAQVAIKIGVALITETTAESLIRDRGRVVGIATNRGPLYGDLVFLAEGDASHLVTREGYERFTDARETPKFLQGIKQVIELPPGAIEDRFQVGPEEGVAYEMLVRNGTLRGKRVHLNMGGFVYANRQSLSVGLVLPAHNLHEHFEGDPNLLMQWFEDLPVLEPWLRSGRRSAFGAKLIRGGGARDIPTLVDDGLAIGGAASAIGIDFPYPNFTGPATAMGRLLTQAVCRIRADGGQFTRDNLRRHYLEPLQQTHYWRDVEFLRHWPGYIKRTQVFFDRQIDAALGTAYLWTRPDRWFLTKGVHWLRLMAQVAGPAQWNELQTDLRHLSRALRLKEIFNFPGWGRLLLDGTLNALRDLIGTPRANLPRAGTVKLHYQVAGEAEPHGRLPFLLRHWFHRFAPVLASAAGGVYSNDTRQLAEKMSSAVWLFGRQVNLLDLVAAAGLGIAVGTCSILAAGWKLLIRAGRRSTPLPPVHASNGLYPSYAQAAEQAGDLTRLVAQAAQDWDHRLGQLAYHTVKQSHIHVHWPQSLPDKNQVPLAGLWHVCPARVYEARVNPDGQVQVVVNFENCIKCETCWRTSDLADWGRDGRHTFIYPVHTPVVGKLLGDVDAAGLTPAALPRSIDWWAADVEELEHQVEEVRRVASNGQDAAEVAELAVLLDRLDRKLEEFDEALAEEPRTVDRARAEWLEMLARYAQQLAVQLVDSIRGSSLIDNPQATMATACQKLLQLANNLSTLAEERTRRTMEKQFAWAAAIGRQLRQHHLTGLRRFLGVLTRHMGDPTPLPNQTRAWLADQDMPGPASGGQASAEIWAKLLDAVLGPGAWRDLERQTPLTSEHDALLRDLVAQIPVIDPNDLGDTLHPPRRKALLAELGRRDPSLAFRVMSHLWARDLARLEGGKLLDSAQRWERVEEWACFASIDATEDPEHRWTGEAIFIPARAAASILLLIGHQLVVMPVANISPESGLTLEPLQTLGLRGAGASRIQLNGYHLPADRARADSDRIQRAWSVLSAADLISVASGMAGILCERAIGHATSRVQFPGLFQDEQARDAIGKFGAIKKMIAEMGACRYLIDTVDRALSPIDITPAAVGLASLLKAMVAEVLGTAPGSISYNAGQVFGGTGYSEDDILSKFYRDAAAWRFLGPANPDVYARHGTRLWETWGQDAAGPTSFPEEETFFDEVVQRKALQAELDRVRVLRSRLRETVTAFQRVHELAKVGAGAWSLPDAQFCDNLARQDAHLLASKALLLHTHARLENGLPAETEVALLRVWLERASAGQDAFASQVRRMADGAPVERARAGGPPTVLYKEYLASPCPYDSGDFFKKPIDPLQPRYVPEMVEADPSLAERDRQLRELIAGYFGQLRGEGIPYERYIEQQHRPDPADLDFCRRHGFFRMTIARESGGEGRPKVDYYRLTTHAHRLADIAISLTIQVNTSLSTTPILLARDKDLPRAKKDLAASCNDPALDAEEIDRRIEACNLFLQWIASGQIAAFALTEPSAGSDTARVATRAVLRSVAVEQEPDGRFRFLPAGGKEPRFVLDARHIVFRWDEQDPAEVRVYYGLPDEAAPALIRFDEYDYETDDPQRTRYYEHDGRRIHFTDIAQFRQRDTRLWYDYWELSGSKMWITNGRVAGVMCLYAKTAKGVTGFLVDRHAEGLIVGKDEEKMGQCGSPTNEVALQAVRVPRENVLGLEGRGQVNALETLNVGRAGLAMSAVAQMAGLIDQSRARVIDSEGEIPAGPAWRLQRMEQCRFLAESIAFEVIGRFEHPQTRSVRLESAIAKMLVSELWHHMIELAEEVHGLAGQTQLHLVEKRKRDARVLNIYEGTNEIQRFFILRDLITFAGPGRGNDQPGQGIVGSEAGTLEVLKGAIQQRIDAAVGLFGQKLAQEPNLQANCFVLAEAIAWFKAADSALGRVVWLDRRTEQTGEAVGNEQRLVGRQALAQCVSEVEDRLRRFDEQFVQLRRGFYAPHIRAASLLFDRSDQDTGTEPSSQVGSRITRPLHVLVVIEPTTAAVPHPQVADHRLLEAHWTLTEADQAALETALRLRDQARDRVSVQVAAVGPRGAASCLRQALSLGVTGVRLLVSEIDTVTPGSAADALGMVLKSAGKYDLILGGSGVGGGAEGLVALITGAILGLPHAGTANQIAVRATQTEDEILLIGADHRQRVRSLPASVTIEPGLTLRPYTLSGYLANLPRQVQADRWPRRIEGQAVGIVEAEATTGVAQSEAAAGPLAPQDAAGLVLDAVGLRGLPGGLLAPFPGPIEDVRGPDVLTTDVVGVLAADAEGRLAPSHGAVLQAIALLTARGGRTASVLLLVADNVEVQRRTVAQLQAQFSGDVVLLASGVAPGSAEVRCQLLEHSWPATNSKPLLVIGEPWTEQAFIRLGISGGRMNTLAPRVCRLALQSGHLQTETILARGKLRAEQILALAPGTTSWISLSQEAESGDAGAPATPPAQGSAGRIQRWSPHLERFYASGDLDRLVQELKQETGISRLSDADFIIDVGFGVRNRDGYEAVIQPLEQALRALGVRNLAIGGSRKVTEELHLLPADRQIGQSGVSVNPRVILAIGISGAPQHLNYIGPRATIVAFNRDPEAPLMTLNQRQAKPRVFPVVGDLFETVAAFTEMLRRELGDRSGAPQFGKVESVSR